MTSRHMDVEPMQADLTAVYVGVVNQIEADLQGALAKLPKLIRPNATSWPDERVHLYATAFAKAHILALGHFSAYLEGRPAGRFLNDDLTDKD